MPGRLFCTRVCFLGLLCCPLSLLAQSGSPSSTRVALSGPDAQENRSEESRHVTGDLGGARERLSERGFAYALEYLSDSLGNVRSVQPARFTSYSRVRGTVDFDFEKLAQVSGLTVHITGVWQTGANQGAYLGTIATPSAISTFNAFRLDAWWVQQRLAGGKIALRFGQFAGLDSYASQHFGGSFIAQPIGYALTAVGNTNAAFQPFATSAAELRIAPLQHVYIKSMVSAGDPHLVTDNLTGFVPQFRGRPVSLSEVGWTLGTKASAEQTDTVADRRGYTGLYKFGAAFNPGKLPSAHGTTPASSNYTLYGLASQALWRTHPNSGVGPDATAGVSWGPGDRNRQNAQLTLGLRYNELLPMHLHNTVSFAYVRSGISSQFPPTSLSQQHAENLLELNTLITFPRGIVFQPAVQRILDVGVTSHSDTLLGFRSKVNF